MTIREWLGLGGADEKRFSVDDYLSFLNTFTFNGVTYSAPPNAGYQTLAGKAEPTPAGFQGLTEQAFGGNPVVFACMAVRQAVFSSIRFQWQKITNGRPGEIFGNDALRMLEEPWPGGTTQDLLARMIQDVDLAGNNYLIRDTPFARVGGDMSTFSLLRLRPDWVVNVRGTRIMRGGQVGWTRLGIAYFQDGQASGNDPVSFLPGEFSHFAPTPDPLADWRGMSWLTPLAREIQSDGQMTRHKQKYFENGATPNIFVKYPAGATEEDMRAVQALFKDSYEGVDNAYRTMHIGGGADVQVVGNDMSQISFKTVQGAGETRIAAAAQVPAVVVGISEGLAGSSLNAGNYASSRRRFADGTMHPLWANAAGSLAPLIATDRNLGKLSAMHGNGSLRLWYDPRDVPFLREDSKDEAEIRQVRASTIRQYIDAGFEPPSAVLAVDTGDLSKLKHTGLFSVQLQPPGTTAPAPADDPGGTDPADPADAPAKPGMKPGMKPDPMMKPGMMKKPPDAKPTTPGGKK